MVWQLKQMCEVSKSKTCSSPAMPLFTVSGSMVQVGRVNHLTIRNYATIEDSPG